MPITPLLAAIFGVMYLMLSLTVVKTRFAQKVSLGSQGNSELEKAVRIHANFIEYVPMCLLLFWFIESAMFKSEIVFWLGSALVAARIAHVVGMREPESFLILRQLGAVGTFGVLLIASAYLLWWYLPFGAV